MQKEEWQKVVVFTGASTGFGKGVALRLADRGCQLALTPRRPHLLADVGGCMREARREGRHLGPRRRQQPERRRDLAGTALQRFGRIDAAGRRSGRPEGAAASL
jgi:NAD(P)-dependent dehydrogenase (short-subunit alcohol dehydrogenase family)